ncbi:hypothetical protein LXA43DRAFT_1159421 [Ganoderma leucocontextum]|nr:hypothetical protein LXA43DRAFT_1159421 [Ganoderma leucocontextum]
MSLNDTAIQATKGTSVYPGVANPHPCPDADPMQANFVLDPTTETRGAGAGETFAGGKDAARALKQTNTADVVEGRPGIIESTHVDPLNEHSNDDGWANERAAGGGRKA